MSIHNDGNEEGPDGMGIAGQSGFASKNGSGTRESWGVLPVLPFEPTNLDETKMLCDRLSLLWISQLYREVIDWEALEAVSAEISRLEGTLFSVDHMEY